MTGVHGGFKTACFCLEVLVIFGGRVRFVATVICNVCNNGVQSLLLECSYWLVSLEGLQNLFC